MILERDATPARPMVLVVSSIWWAPEEMDEGGTAILLPHPTLELTDGWYRVRAEVDEALARATRRRKIRLGSKLVVVGAKVRMVFGSLSSPRCSPGRRITRCNIWIAGRERGAKRGPEGI